MKKSLMFVIALAFCVTASFPGRKCLANERMHVIKENGAVKCEVVVPEESGPVAVFAGKELQSFLSESLGVDIPAVKTPTGKNTAIILGNNQFSRKAGINMENLPRDGFIIKSVGNDIFILGKDDLTKHPEILMKSGYWAQLYERGTLFGVYGFLERFLGVRFYFPGKVGTVVSRHDTLSLPELNIVEKPDFTVRKISAYSGVTPDGHDDANVLPFRSMNYYRLRLETEYLANCHGLSRLGYLARFGKSHPEYFAMMSDCKRHNNPLLPHPGQLCLSSGIRDEIYKDAEAFLTGVSAKERGVLTERFGYCWDLSGFQPGYFCIMPQDSFYECRCPECQKHFSKGKKATSEFIWDFVCDTAEKLKKNNVPGYVTMMSYSPYNIIPDRKIPDNVLVMLAVSGPWSLHLPAVSEKDEKEIKAWVEKLGRKVWLWNYTNKYGKRDMPGVPAVTPKCIGEYYKRVKPYIFGAYMQSDTDRYIYNYLNHYVFAKVCWNNSADVEAMLGEHYRKMFGKAASVMEKIYGRFEVNWLKAIGQSVNTPLGPVSAPVSDYELWERIYSTEEIDLLDRHFAEAEKLVDSSPADKKRVAFMRAQLLEPIRERRAIYVKNNKEIGDLLLHANELGKDMKIEIDGKLDDRAWQDSEKIFLRPFVKDGAPQLKAVKTAVRAAKDEENLYFSFDCEEPSMRDIVSAKRDYDDREIWHDSSVEIFLNPSGDRKKYYQILLNVSGSVADLYCKPVGGGRTSDWKWNSGTVSAVRQNSNSWTAEIVIPIKSLEGFNREGFPVNFNRNRILLSKDRDYAVLFTWSPFLRHGFHELEHFGSMTFKAEANDNLIQNGDFTEPVKDRFFGSWSAPDKRDLKPGEAWAITSDSFIKGGQSLTLNRKTAEGKIGVTQYLPKMEPDTEYLLTFFIRTENLVPLPGGKSGGACVNIYDDTNRWFPKNFYTGNMPWTKQGFQFRTNSATNHGKPSYIRLWLMNASGAVWFDDVRLRKLPEASR